MIPHPAHGGTPATLLFDDLDRTAGLFLRLVRLWSWGNVHRLVLRLAAPQDYGVAGANCLLTALDEFCALLGGPGGCHPDIRLPDSAALSPDEAGLVAAFALAADDPRAVAPHLAAGLGRDRARAVMVAAHAVARVIAAPAPARSAAACPAGCPARSGCPERPALRLVPPDREPGASAPLAPLPHSASAMVEALSSA